MRRLCFLSPDVDHARAVVADLKADGIAEKHIYTLSRSDQVLEGLPDAGPEADDFLPAFERGVAVGGAAGVFLGLVAMAFPPTGLVIGGGGVLLLGLAGASVSGMLTGMAGAAFPSSRLHEFEAAIDAGQILIMVDVKLADAQRVSGLIARLEPVVEVEGLEPPATLIPK